MEEVWKQIKDYPDYEVSDHGRVRSNKRGKTRIMKQVKDTKGYFQVGLTNLGKKHLKIVHRIILESFVGASSNGTQGSHLDDNKENNRISNLVWETSTDNNRRRKSNKLNYLKSSWIRLLLERGWSPNSLCKEFNVGKGSISSIKHYRNWKRRSA